MVYLDGRSIHCKVLTLFPSYPFKPLLVTALPGLQMTLPTNTRLMVQWEHFPALICLGLVSSVLSLSALDTFVPLGQDVLSPSEIEMVSVLRELQISLGRSLQNKLNKTRKLE